MDLTQSLFQWLKTFDLTANCRSTKDLCDGVAISRVLNQICPEYFNTEWLHKIETDCGTNYRLRVSNLRKICDLLGDYYSEVLDKPIDDKLLPNEELIGRDHNSQQLALLLQLILGCAIYCDRKEHFIAIMTNLDFEVQHGIKTAIQRLETFDDSMNANDSPFTPNDDNTQESTLNSWQRRCEQLEEIVNKVNNEKRLLESENEKLSKELDNIQHFEPKSDSFDREVVFQQLNQEIIRLKTELSKTEELKEDFRMSSELRKQEVNKLRQQSDQLNGKLSGFKKDMDELDRLRYLNEEVERYKNKDENLKKKIEELKETKRQFQDIEERNVSLTKRISDLEEEIKKLSVFKGQIDVYKKQREDMRLKVAEESYRADRAEDETNRLTKKLEELMEEKDKYLNELSDMRRDINQYKDVNPISLELTRLVSDNELTQTMSSHKQETIRSELLDAQEVIASLKAVISKKDVELAEKEERYQKYLTKAKTTLGQMPSVGSDTSNDLAFWKQLAQQGELELSKLKSEYDESMDCKELEARLMSISFHNLSSHLQRKSAEDRIRNGSVNPSAHSASFLSRQRQASTRKYNMPNVTQRLWTDHKNHNFL